MRLYKNTVSDLLWKSLIKLMSLKEFKSFRLVGGTALSLQLGHRKSLDIDLFTDAEYKSIDFNMLDSIIKDNFPYVDSGISGEVSLGKSYFIGESKNNAIKLDLYYTDPFAFPLINSHNIRLTAIEEITAMKLELIANGGRKKDFWDLHELFNTFSLNEMLYFYKKRYPYGFSKQEILNQLTNFENAEDDFLPICLLGKNWDLVKLDILESIDQL